MLMFPYTYFWVFVNITEVARKALFSLANKDSLTTCCVPNPMLFTVMVVGGGLRSERTSLKELPI